MVLVQFWTYSCVNWIRTLPYVRAWAEKYRDQGLVVIGVHAPEFGFEHQLANVRWASGNLRVDYPVAMDNDFAIWRAFGNQYWPALYLIDGKGRVRHRHFGEGDYEQSERVIQDLLAEAGARGVEENLVSVTTPGAEAPADWDNLKSPETYLGTARSENRVSADARLRLNEWALKGKWTVGKQPAVLEEANGRISVSVPRPRPQPGDDAWSGRQTRALSGSPRRTRARPLSRHRCGRAGQRSRW